MINLAPTTTVSLTKLFCLLCSFDKKLNLYYYFNSQTNQSSWEHPLDGEIRDLVKKCKLESSSSTG